MPLNAYELSAGVFVRGLTNLKMQLTKAEAHAAARGSGEAALLGAQLAEEVRGVAGDTQNDLHMYTLAAQVHWAAEGAKLAIVRLLGAPPVPAANDAKSFADLHRRLDATIAYLREICAKRPRSRPRSRDRDRAPPWLDALQRQPVSARIRDPPLLLSRDLCLRHLAQPRRATHDGRLFGQLGDQLSCIRHGQHGSNCSARPRLPSETRRCHSSG
jgi:hypothetical protein